jgi:hypothetical protein
MSAIAQTNSQMDFSKSFSNESLKFISWLSTNYEIKANTGSCDSITSFNDFSIENFKEPKRNKIEKLAEYLMESFSFDEENDPKIIAEKFKNRNKKEKETATSLKVDKQLDIKVDASLDTSDMENLDTLDLYTSELIDAFKCNPQKTGDEDSEHRYEWKIQVNEDIYSIYDWKNDDNTFDDLEETTWYLAGNDSNQKTQKAFVEYLDKFQTK